MFFVLKRHKFVQYLTFPLMFFSSDSIAFWHCSKCSLYYGYGTLSKATREQFSILLALKIAL